MRVSVLYCIFVLYASSMPESGACVDEVPLQRRRDVSAGERRSGAHSVASVQRLAMYIVISKPKR
jgi:hypothetical protein